MKRFIAFAIVCSFIVVFFVNFSMAFQTIQETSAKVLTKAGQAPPKNENHILPARPLENVENKLNNGDDEDGSGSEPEENRKDIEDMEPR